MSGPAPVLVLVVGAGVAGALRGGFTDLFVYLYGGHAALEGLPVYESRDTVTGLHFTYPPFAAIVMVPLALLPTWLAAALWTGASMGAIAAVVLVVAARSTGPRQGGWSRSSTGGAVALEPVWQNLAFGQTNLFLMLAVLVDLLRPERRWSGVLVGIAAGVKLTPLVFVVLLVLVGRRAAAGRAALAFAGTVAVGFVVMPGSAAMYWADGLVDAGRVGPPELAHNQSVYGALTRLLDGPPPTWVWLAVAGPLALAVLVVGAGWWRRGDRVLGTCLAALAMLFASPISWSHHWVWAVPVALVLGSAAGGREPRGPRCSWPGRSCGRPTVRTANSGGVRSTSSSATPTSSPPWPSPSGRRPPSTAESAHRYAVRTPSRPVRAQGPPDSQEQDHRADTSIGTKPVGRRVT